MEEELYEKKFALLEPWTIQILNDVKKELKNDHLQKDHQFVQKHFTKKTIEKLTVEEMKDAYVKEINEGNQEAGEWIASRWVLKHAEIYHFFSEKLAEINPKFDEIKTISDEIGKKIMQLAVAQFGALKCYVFSVLNCVKFSDALYQELRLLAEKDKKEEVTPTAPENAADVKEHLEKEILKITDKYEKRLLGFQKKYNQDVTGLKKQIAALQRKLGEKSVV